jgi:hypothetical protein
VRPSGEQPGDTDLEELVQVRREDRAEAEAVEERDGLVLGELQHAAVELEVRELSVEEAPLRRGLDVSRHAALSIGSGARGVTVR